MLTADRVRQALKYDAGTGVFTWRIGRQGAAAGSVAGCVDIYGYRIIGMDRRGYRAHRLAWLYAYGHWPTAEIDHIDGDRLNNRIANLREATRSENQRNVGVTRSNTSGFKGVYWYPRDRKWQAKIMLGGKSKHLGLFDSPDLAHAAYCEAAGRIHGDFARVA
jgi:hypothetical protein